MQLHNLFPIPVGFAELGRPLSDEELFFIRELPTRPNMGNTTSTNNFVLRDSALTSLRSFIEDSVSDYFKNTVNPKHNVSLRVTQSWCNYSEPGQYHHKHAHPNSLVSGVFYINCDDKFDKIKFFNDKYKTIKPEIKDWNLYNSESWWFTVKTGDIILFPSSLTHMVENKEGTNTRISLAFNVFIKGNIGNNKNLTELVL